MATWADIKSLVSPPARLDFWKNVMKLPRLITILIGICLIGCQTASTEIVAEPEKLIRLAGEAVAAVAITPAPEIIPVSTEIPDITPTSTQVDQPVTRPPPPTIIYTPTAVPTNVPTETPTQSPTIPPIKPTETIEPTPTPTVSPTAIPTATLRNDLSIVCPSKETIGFVPSPFTVSSMQWPRPSASPYELHIGYTESKIIHLGFDVEGDPNSVIDILDVLDKHQVKTTMFVLGSWAEVYPDLVREIANRGHEFANHTFSHANVKNLSSEQLLRELNSSEALISELTGKSTKPWFRPPYGARSAETIQTAYDAGWTTVIWTGSTDDWRPEFGVEEMCGTLLSGSRPGSILYTHTARPEIPIVLDRYLSTMQAQGYTIVPLSVLMSGNPDAYLSPQK